MASNRDALILDEAFAPLRSVVLQPTTLCNLDCRYCYLPDRAKSSFMSDQVASRVADEVGYLAEAAGSVVEVVWHAGEPLSTGYRRLSKLMSHFGDRKKFRQAIQTNGTLLNQQWIDLFASYEVETGLSIDGPVWANVDRVDLRHRATHARAVKGAQLLRKNCVPFDVIAVLSGEVAAAALDRMSEYLSFFVELGARSLSINTEEIEGINSRGQADTVASSLNKIFFERLIEVRDRSFPDLQIRELDRCERYLDAVLSTEGQARPQPDLLPTISSEGEVSFLSPEFVGMTVDPYEASFGNLLDQTLADLVKQFSVSRLRDDYLLGIDRCEDSCDYFGLCGGGSASNKYFEHGDLRVTQTTHCRNTRIIPFDAFAAQRLSQLRLQNNCFGD